MGGRALKVKRRSVFKQIILTLISMLIILNFPISVFSLEQVSISILKIEPNKYIKGRINGLDPAEYEKYKVFRKIVYVRHQMVTF